MTEQLIRPQRMESLACLHGVAVQPSGQASILSIGEAKQTMRWASSLPDAKIYAFRTLDKDAIEQCSLSVDYLLWQQPPNKTADWAWLFAQTARLLKKEGVVLIRHPISVGAKMVGLLRSMSPAL